MVKTIRQLEREIAMQRRRISKEKVLSEKIIQQRKLERELFQLRNKKLLDTGSKAKRLSIKFGKGILSAGKKAVPIIQKQARLIREQQLRDESIAKARMKRIPKLPKKKKKKYRPSNQNNPGVFSNLDF